MSLPITKLDYRNVLTLPAAEVTTKNPSGRQKYTDAVQRGLYLFVQASGVRMYYVVYRFGNKVRNYKLGPVDRGGDGLPIDEARKRAKVILGRVAAGEDPAAERRTKRISQRLGADSLAALGERLIKTAEIADSTRALWLWLWPKHIAPRNAAGRVMGPAAQPPSMVTRSDVRDLLARIPSKPVAWNAKKLVTWVFARAIEEDIVGASPCVGLGRRKHVPRDRVLTHRELRGLWHAAGTCGRYGHAVRLLILTGARRDEVFGSTWLEMDMDAKVWRIPAERYKTRRAHLVPLTPMMIDVLAAVKAHRGRQGMRPSPSPDPRIFRTTASNWHWNRLIARAGIAPAAGPGLEVATQDANKPRIWKANTIRLHDLRRTVRNALTAELGVNPAVAEAVIGHKPPKIIETYAPTGIGVSDLRQALELWEQHLKVIIEGTV